MRSRTAYQRFSDLPNRARTIWAKSGDTQGHGLLAHMLDVAAVVEAILGRESIQTRAWAAGSLGLAPAMVTQWAAAMAGLHDFGKAIPGFQFKWPAGQRADEAAGLAFRTISLDVHRHDLASGSLLRRELPSRFAGGGWIPAVCQALAAHHGYMPTPMEIKDGMPRYEGPGWSDARCEILDAYLQTLHPGEGLAVDDLPLPAVAWLAGLTSTADWIGSNPDWFPPGERSDDLSGHHAKARALAVSVEWSWRMKR